MHKKFRFLRKKKSENTVGHIRTGTNKKKKEIC